LGEPVIGDLAGYSTLLAARATQSSPGMGLDDRGRICRDRPMTALEMY